MKVVAQMRVRKTPELSDLCHKAKNLWNLGLFYVNMYSETMEEILWDSDLKWMLKGTDAFKALPSAVSQEILKFLSKSWKGYFKALKEYKKDRSKFLGCPRPPQYKPKDGESIAYFDYCAFVVQKDGNITFARDCLPPIMPPNPVRAILALGASKAQDRRGPLCLIRVIPHSTHYLFEFVYEKEEITLNLNKSRVMGIDLNVNNLVCCVTNCKLGT